MTETDIDTDQPKPKKYAKNIVFLCNKKGVVSGIINDALNLDAKKYSGKDFIQIVDVNDRGKAIDLLKRMESETVVQDVEMLFDTGHQNEVFLFTGIQLGNRKLIIASDTYHSLNHLFDEMSRISNEQTNITRELARQKEKVASIERKRIERDLHDSVSQTIFSASIIAELIPELWEKDQEEAKRQMNKLKTLTHDALNEMRRLLMELRPESFAGENIDDLLKQLVNSLKLRSNIDIKLKIEGSRDLSREAKEVIYRITQESLNNAVKHSGADKVSVILEKKPQKTILTITDNGKGFDTKNISKRKLGLYIMDQRAGSINSSLDIKSSPGEGTNVSLVYKYKDGE